MRKLIAHMVTWTKWLEHQLLSKTETHHTSIAQLLGAMPDTPVRTQTIQQGWRNKGIYVQKKNPLVNHYKVLRLSLIMLLMYVSADSHALP